MNHLVIVGNGITGITLAREVRKRCRCQITVVSDETKYFYSRPALMYLYLGHMTQNEVKPYEDWFWEKNKIELVHDRVVGIDTDAKLLFLKDGDNINYDNLVLATGSKTNKFGWPGQDLKGVTGLYSLQDIEYLEDLSRNAENAVIVGGGLIGIELGEMFHSRGIKVTYIVREKGYWASKLPKEDSDLITRHILEHGLDIKLETELEEILPDGDKRACRVLLTSGETLPADIVGLTPGVHPNTDLVKDSKLKIGSGILVNEYMETNIKDIYAAGDCAEIMTPEGSKNKIEQLWYTGKGQAEVLAKTLTGDKTKYERGIWFNSAKFFDIEFQCYGFVSNVTNPEETHFYWEHEDHKHALHFVYANTDRRLIGVNSYGIRLRHRVFEEWIASRKTIDYTLNNLKKANFDPEFFKSYMKQILKKFKKSNRS